MNAKLRILKSLTVWVALIVSNIAIASQKDGPESKAVVYSTDFESFTVGGQVACQDPVNWSTWSNAPCTGEDGYVSTDFSNSGSKSAKIENANDMLLLLGDKTTGNYALSWWMYIETGKAGYYNMQHFESPGVEFAFEIYFFENGTGEFTTQALPAIVFNYPKDIWFQVKHSIDIDNDLITLIINDVEVNSWPLSAVSNSATPGTKQLGAIDFYAGASGSETPKYYFDDVVLKEILPPVYTTDFETFTTGGQVACQDNVNWSTWSNSPCGSEDAYISTDFAHNGVKSAKIENANDLLLLLGDKTTGYYELSWWMYIQNDNAGYYNMQHFESPGVEFAFEIYFLQNGTGEFTTMASPAIVFNYPKDAWFQVKHVIDIDNDLITLTINDNQVNSWPLSAVSNSATPGTKQLGAIDFYAGASGSEIPKYYFDDVMFKDAEPSISNDLALQLITSPVSGPNLTDAEVVTITVKNVGTANQSDIPVSYNINGGITVNEIISGPLAGGASIEYSFAQKADLSVAQTYNFVATVAQPDDENPDNNTKTKTVVNEGSVILMQNGTISSCESRFFDTGGETETYQPGEDLTLTILPATPGAKIIAAFTEFNTENNYDFLKIYDGTDITAPLLGSFSGTAQPGQFIASQANTLGALTFRFTSDGSAQGTGWAATISCQIPKDHDLAGIEVSGTANPDINNTYDYTVTIANFGTNPEMGSSYTVSMYDDNTTLIGTVAGKDINPGENQLFTIPWTPIADGPAYLYAVVSLIGDENNDNNSTPNFDVYVQPAGQATIGVGTGTELSMNVPISPWWGYSFSQTLYLQSELNIANKRIFRIGYQYGGSTTNLDFNIEVWLKHTTLTDLTSTEPLSTFTKVYDGPYVVNAGEEYSTIDIDAFYYNNTDNLLVTVIEKKPGYTSPSDQFYATTNTLPQTLCRGAWNDGSAYDPNNLPVGNIVSVRANTKFWLGDVPTQPEVKITPASLYFGEVEATIPMVKTLEVMNSGGGTLVINGADITNPRFTIPDATFPVNLEIGEKYFFDIQFLPVDPGLEEAILTFQIDESVPGIKTVPLSGRALRFGVLREGFENVLFPPLGWKVIDNNMDGKGWLRNTGFVPTGQTGPRTGVGCASLDVYAGSPSQIGYDDWLVTPQLIWQDGDVFKFFIKRVANQAGQTWRVCLSTTGTEVGDFVPFDEITDPSLSYEEKLYDLSQFGLFDGDLFYIGFQFNSLWCWPGVIDDVLGPVVNRFDNDLLTLSMTGNDIVYANSPTNYQVKIGNNGNTAVAGTDYTVDLRAYVGGIETVFGSVPGQNLAQGETIDFTISSTFPQIGTYDLFAKIDWEADMNPTNNISTILPVEVISSSMVIKNIGDFPIDNETDYYNQYPINFADSWRSTSLSECLYFQNELNTGGIIERLTYYRNFPESINNRNIKIWMGTTGSYSLNGSYIPPSALQLVFDGKVSFQEGRGKANFELMYPYVYTGNGNLVVNVYYYDGGNYVDGATFAYTEDYTYYRTSYETGWQTIDPESPAYLGTTTNYPNTTLMFETGNGLGLLHGYVYYQADNAPVDGAKIEIFNPDFPEVKAEIFSDGSGYYSAPYAMAGTNLTVTISKFGYSDVVYENVNLANGGSTYLGNAYLVTRPLISMMGTVYKSDTYEPARFATVKLFGLENYETTTEVLGEFLFENIWGLTTYQIEISLDGYQTYVAEIDVPGESLLLDPITLLENAPAPNLVNAVEQDENALITWYASGQPYPMEFRYDDGIVDGVLITPGTPTLFTGSVWFNHAIINSVHFYNFEHENYPPSPQVRIIFLGLTAEGAPDESNQLALFEDVRNDFGWNTFDLPSPVEAPEGFFVGIAGYSNYTTISYDDGVGEPYEWHSRTQWGNGLGNYNPLENGTSPPLHGNILVRTSGLVYGDVSKSFLPVSKAATEEITEEKLLSLCIDTESFDTGSPTVKVPYLPGIQPKSFQHYNVYRKALDETNWTAVSTTPVSDTSYTDETWSGLGFGLYLYGVEAEYTNGVKSVMAESNIIEKNMRIDLNLTVLTNTGVPGMSEGAMVKLSNQNGNINYVYYGTIGADESVIIPQVLKGVYDLEITKPGFQDYSELGIDLFVEGLTFEKTVTILEYIYDPYDLEVETNGQLAGNALFLWNQSPVFDNVDSYDPFLVDNMGEWTVVDQDNNPTVSINGISFPHMGEPFAFITLDRSLTTPPLSEAYWSGHSGNQYFAGFASAEGTTSNWLISPLQNHSLPFTLSFWAKGVNDVYGAETFRIAYSSTGMNLSDFVYITGDIPTSIYWTDFKYTIPAEAKYVAIRHTHTGFALLVDDILLGVEADNSIPANGFSIYLDGSEIESGFMASDYTFQGVLPGTHTAGVQSHFYTGESGISETEFVMPAGIMLNFQVQDDKGVLLDGALIKLLYNGSEIFATQSVAGFASIGVTPGTWQYEVTFSDLVPVPGEVVVTGEEEDLLVVLNHYYTLTFNITDEGGHPVEGAVVAFKYETQTTGLEGTVSFVSEPGVYPYAVNHPDFNRILASVNLTDNQTEIVVLTELECEPPTNLAFSQYYNNVQLTWEPPVPGSNGEWLHWDGENTGNSIGTGGLVDFDVAQRFEPSDLVSHNGKFLTRIVFIPREELCTYSVRVWIGGNIAEPEIMIVDQEVTNPVIGEWNEITLAIPVYVDASKELWFGVRNNTTTGYPAGCDIGPAVNGKGNMINLAGQGWITLLEASASLNYNWSVRAILEEMDGKSSSELVSIKDGYRGSFNGVLKVVNYGNSKGFEEPKWLLGYNIYRNDIKLNENLLNVLYFDDAGLPLGNHFYSVSAVYTNGCESASTIEVVVDERLGQFIQLYQGWQAISTYQVPDYPDLPDFFSHQIANQSLQIVLGKTGIFWPGQNINTLGNWDTHQGYKLKMNADDLLNVGGEMIADKTVQLAMGISYLPILSETPVPADEIFAQLAGHLTYAFDIRLGQIYWPAGGLYTLQYLEPGVGYLVAMSSAGNVTFPDTKGQNNGSNSAPGIITNSPWTIQKSDVGHIVSVYSSALTKLQRGDFIGAFNEKGDCVGFVMYDGQDSNLGLVVYGDDFTTEITDGMLENETISFRIYNTTDMTEAVVNPVWNDRMPQSGFFAENGLSAVTDLKQETFGIAEQDNLSAQIYPNPANDHLFVELNYDAPAVLMITDQVGKTVHQQNLKQNNERIDLSSLQPGVYMVRITSDNVQPFCEKIIVK